MVCPWKTGKLEKSRFSVVFTWGMAALFFLVAGRYRPPRCQEVKRSNGFSRSEMMPSMSRPIIGLNADFIPAGKATKPHLRLNQGYADAVLTAGGLPILMPLLDKEADIQAFLDRVDGFVLTGGLDLDPRRLGLPRHHAVTPMPERREERDRIIVRLLMERQMPILGVGVGI
jgi:hypothetical protein